jgi:hypothetical protein
LMGTQVLVWFYWFFYAYFKYFIISKRIR